MPPAKKGPDSPRIHAGSRWRPHIDNASVSGYPDQSAPYTRDCIHFLGAFYLVSGWWTASVILLAVSFIIKRHHRSDNKRLASAVAEVVTHPPARVALLAGTRGLYEIAARRVAAPLTLGCVICEQICSSWAVLGIASRDLVGGAIRIDNAAATVTRDAIIVSIRITGPLETTRDHFCTGGSRVPGSSTVARELIVPDDRAHSAVLTWI